MLRWFTIVLSVLGLAVGVVAVAVGKQEIPDTPLARPASVNPFGKGVAALGIVEPSGRAIEIASADPGLVAEVLVDVGDVVKKDQVLMRLDARAIESQIVAAKGELAGAEAEVARWHAIPRAEDVPPLEAALLRAKAQLVDAQDKLARSADAVKTGAMSARDVASAEAAVQIARAEFVSAQANLDRLKAGGWKADLVVAEAAAATVRARIASLELLKDRLTVRSPRDGTVLRREVEAGEYILGPVSRTRAPLVIGDLTKLHVRAQVDEEDIGLVAMGSKAIGRTRGAVQRELELKIVRIEPFARPKPTLSGSNIERTDTRVIDVVLEVVEAVGGKGEYRIVPGQAVDVFLDAAK
jgi:HlyD family secretion protein